MGIANSNNEGQHRGSGLLSWLGLSGRAEDDSAGSPPPPPWQFATRAQRFAAVGLFLDRHDLELNPRTFRVAWDYLGGHDEALVSSIDRRVKSGRAVTSEWLEEFHGRHELSEEAAALRDLRRRLEASVEEFGISTREAHGAATEYREALSGQVGELEQVAKASAVISKVALIGKAMVRRTQELEKQMMRSSAQTRALKRRLNEARRASEQDHLTGLPNRRAFEAVYEREHRAAREAGETLSVGFCDIDHFKRINDEHGHAAGDRVLRLVAEMLAEVSNDRCHVARHGGEEFVVLMRGRSPLEAQRQLDQVRSKLAQRRLVNRSTDTPFGQVTFSAGVAHVFDYDDPRAALQAADCALYRAKLDGRNRVFIAEPRDGSGELAA